MSTPHPPEQPGHSSSPYYDAIVHLLPNILSELRELSQFMSGTVCDTEVERILRAASALQCGGEPHVTDDDRPFVANIARLMAASIRADFPTLPPKESPIIEIGPDLDYLNLRRLPWSTAKALNFVLMRALKPRRKCAVLASVRNEGPFLLEFISHCRVIGVEKIFVYTNDNEDLSEPMLRRLAENGIITLILNRLEKSAGPKLSPQVKSYEHAIHLLPELRDFEWVLVIDADEFVVAIRRGPHATMVI